MKFAHTHLIATGLLAATLGFAATAQTPAPAPAAVPAGAHQGHRGFDPAKMQERIAKRQAELKQKLQITAGQEAAWASFTTAMKPGARPHRDHAAFAALSTPDRIDQMRALRAQRIAEMDRRADATKAFYAVLTAEQKKVFDAETMRHGHRGHGGHGGHHKG